MLLVHVVYQESKATGLDIPHFSVTLFTSYDCGPYLMKFSPFWRFSVY